FDFSATDSQRLRVGTRLRYLLDDRALAYVGAAWEHEFDGGAQATVYGFQTPSPSLKGDTGVFEVGLDITPRQSKALSVNLGVQAYTGKREGMGGTLQLKYAF
ncbi:MAG TPA: autotransporter domain-containing protein, partial [Castellaniella sp.]|nr:autotransporter domain-containing protein [Castellaniella sp.]